MGPKPMASDDRIRLSPDDRNYCVGKLQLLVYGSTTVAEKKGGQGGLEPPLILKWGG